MRKNQVVPAFAILFAVGCSSPEQAPGPIAVARHVEAPPADAVKPVDYPGLHNVVAYAKGLTSGAAPGGREGFESLAAMGVKTIVSVDGAIPDTGAARALGLRYVHLPIGYNGMDRARILELARAIKDLPGPVYVHCHHGKHRSACAIGAATVALGVNTPEQATARMRVSGTAPSYEGLFRSVATTTVATPAELAVASTAFPEVSRPSDMVGSMLEIDEVTDHLRAIEKAGWKTPRSHPDLVPAALVGRLADLFRHLRDDGGTRGRPAELGELLANASATAERLEERLVASGISEDLSARFRGVTASCKQCHDRFRD